MAEKIYTKCLRNCTPNCHQVEFTYTKEQIERDPEIICNEYVEHGASGTGNSLENIIARYIMFKGNYNSLVYKYSKISEWEKLYKIRDESKEFNITINEWDENNAEMDLCKTLVKDHIAKVSVMFDRKKYVRTLTSLKATFNDKLANFGK